MASPLTVGMFGERYHGSGTILALLSLGYYCNAALGFNGLTLRVYGLVRYVVVISAIAAAVNVALNLVLIPLHGAIGAGIATAVTMIAHNVLKQAGLRRGTGISVFEWRHSRVYVVIVIATGCAARRAVGALARACPGVGDGGGGVGWGARPHKALAGHRGHFPRAGARPDAGPSADVTACDPPKVEF